jgi:hypothetical protein
MLNLVASLVRLHGRFTVAASAAPRLRTLCAPAWAARLMLAGFVVAGCAAPQSKPEKPPSYLRSPTLDYQDQPRSASDGEVMGAQRQSPDETLQASPTNEHLAPGWEIENGMLVASPEARQRGHGSHAHEPGCEPAEQVKSPEANTDPKAKPQDEKDPVRKALRPVCRSETSDH